MDSPWPPVIYLTGVKSLHTEIEIKRLGAVAVIYKPFEFSILLDTIKRAIGTSPHAG
jgi:FixJ family two-component response regulator